MYILEVSYGCPSEKYPSNGNFQLVQTLAPLGPVLPQRGWDTGLRIQLSDGAVCGRAAEKTCSLRL